MIERRDKPIDLEGLWAPCPAFLVGGGPSLRDFPLERLKDRGVLSLAVNHAAAVAPVKAWVFSDWHGKFHQNLFLDPAIMTFAPQPKMRRKLNAKVDGVFFPTKVRIRDCPNTFGYHRQSRFVPETFFTDRFGHWGPRADQPKDKPEEGCLCTMLIGLRLLFYLGVRTVYLLGVDYKGRDGLCYGFPCDKGDRRRRYKWEGHMLRRLGPEMEKRGLEVYNCNPDTDCDVFPVRLFNEALAHCKGSVTTEEYDTEEWYATSRWKDQREQNPPFKPVNF